MGAHLQRAVRRHARTDDDGTRQAAMPSADMPATALSVSFDDFQVLRAVGRGTFGKVCIVHRRVPRSIFGTLRRRRRAGAVSTPKYFAMKYVNKSKCIAANSVHNVMREMSLMASLQHPFCVNLWYTFHDARDMFMVCDLLLGGDLRYHLNDQGRFDEARVKLYTCELAIALDYLHGQRIIHRDVKPDNILLDDEGHAHLTDFNVATRLESEDALATSVTGTRPYMAPEIYECSLGHCLGYGQAVDWWSLGVTMYEMLRGRRPFDFAHTMEHGATLHLLTTTAYTVPTDWSMDLVAFIAALLAVRPECRTKHIADVKAHVYMSRVNFADVLERKCAPVFTPRTDALNCDPTYELEEHIIESSPIHSRKSRGRSAQNSIASNGAGHCKGEFAQINADFNVYNRESVLKLMDKFVAKQKEVERANGSTSPTAAPPSTAMKSSCVTGDTAYIIGNLNGTPNMAHKTFGFRDMLRGKKKSTAH